MGDKICPLCGLKYDTEQRDVLESALDHWVKDHADTDTFRDILTDVTVAVECKTCGDEFESDISVGAGRIGADCHCPYCVENDQFRGIWVRELTPREVLDYQVN